MRVLYDEDLAGHNGPESCAGVREDGGEALTGVHAGRVSSLEKLNVQGADAVEIGGRQHETARHGKRRPSPAWSKTSRTHASHLQGNRDIHWLTTRESPTRAVRIGKVHP
jgi:hypothetical protein